MTGKAHSIRITEEGMLLQTSTVAVTKYLTRSKLSEERFVFTYSRDILCQVENGCSSLTWIVTSRSQSGNRVDRI